MSQQQRPAGLELQLFVLPLEQRDQQPFDFRFSGRVVTGVHVADHRCDDLAAVALQGVDHQRREIGPAGVRADRSADGLRNQNRHPYVVVCQQRFELVGVFVVAHLGHRHDAEPKDRASALRRRGGLQCQPAAADHLPQPGVVANPCHVDREGGHVTALVLVLSRFPSSQELHRPPAYVGVGVLGRLDQVGLDARAELCQSLRGQFANAEVGVAELLDQLLDPLFGHLGLLGVGRIGQQLVEHLDQPPLAQRMELVRIEILLPGEHVLQDGTDFAVGLLSDAGCRQQQAEDRHGGKVGRKTRANLGGVALVGFGVVHGFHGRPHNALRGRPLATVVLHNCTT